MVSALSPLAVSLALGLLLMVSFRKHLRCQHIPGPFLARLTRLWYVRQMTRGEFQHTNIELHKRHGKIVRIAPGWFSFDDTEALKVIYGHGSKFTKSDWYDAWSFSKDNVEQHNMFSVRDIGIHSKSRRKVAAMYSMSSLVSYEPYVNNCIERLRAQLDSFAASGSPIDLGHWLQCYAFDVIGQITYGERFGFLDHGNDVNNLIANLNSAFTLSCLLGLYTWMMPLILFITGFTATSDMLYISRFTDRKITEIAESETLPTPDAPIPMIQKLIDAQANGEKGMSHWDVKANASSNIGAGSDTTAISLTAIVFYLYQSPDRVERLREEIKQHGLGKEPTFQEVQKMPFLQAIIKEALRLHPAVGFPLFRVVPKGGAVICNQYFTEGDNVGVNPWVIHRNQTVWGPDADKFRPERWLSKDIAQLSHMEQSLIPFGIGSRTCIGKNISLLEVNKLIPHLVRAYDIHFEETKNLKARTMWFAKPVGCQAKISMRSTY